jgi:hypothetical protein
MEIVVMRAKIKGSVKAEFQVENEEDNRGYFQKEMGASGAGKGI